MVKRVCPACQHRTDGVIPDDCPICWGAGTLTLHPAALSLFDAQTVSRAAAIALEAIAEAIDAGHSLSDPQTELLAARVGELEAAGLVYLSPAVVRVPDNVRSLTPRRQCPGQTTLADAAHPVQLALDFSPKPHTEPLASAAAYRYGEDERPMMRGLPVLSEAGHPSSLARICDPVDQLVGTRERVRADKARSREARVLLEAVPAAARRRARRTA